MDDLRALRKNAGLAEDEQDHQRNIESLNELSDNFEFQINEYGNIDVYSIAGTLVGSFDDFDTMLVTGLE